MHKLYFQKFYAHIHGNKSSCKSTICIVWRECRLNSAPCSAVIVHLNTQLLLCKPVGRRRNRVCVSQVCACVCVCVHTLMKRRGAQTHPGHLPTSCLFSPEEPCFACRTDTLYRSDPGGTDTQAAAMGEQVRAMLLGEVHLMSPWHELCWWLFSDRCQCESLICEVVKLITRESALLSQGAVLQKVHKMCLKSL